MIAELGMRHEVPPSDISIALQKYEDWGTRMKCPEMNPCYLELCARITIAKVGILRLQAAVSDFKEKPLEAFVTL